MDYRKCVGKTYKLDCQKEFVNLSGIWVPNLPGNGPSIEGAQKVGGMFYVRHHDGSIGHRYYDDTDQSWWLPSVYGYHPNDSFKEYLLISNNLKNA